MKFQISGHKENLLVFSKEGRGVEFKGNLLYEVNKYEINWYFKKDSRVLEEYEILKEVLEITSIGNSSLASVKIVFRRRIKYHITKTFLQVCVYENNKPKGLHELVFFFSDICSCYDWIFIFILWH